VHRDVSPSNILVSYDGGIKLLDFGIARITAMQASTGQDVLKGKVPYMSPEQCRGEPLDRRSDVFSLGVVLWELTARRRLFVGDNELVIASRICGQDAPRRRRCCRGIRATSRRS
jgi:serine/threonine protein kinase